MKLLKSISIGVAVQGYAYAVFAVACRHESAQQARRAMRTADPLPSPPITAGAATAMLCVLGLAGACVTVAALILF